MNQEKIGKFIAECRKKQNLTQEQLAEQLGITKNAVSKWERGLGLMDMSLLKPLSKILKVSITEILNGEQVDKEDISSKTEKALLDTIDYSSREIKKIKKNKIITILLTVIFTLLSLILLDTLQAKIFDNTPILKIRESYNGGNLYYIDKGFIVNHYYCSNNKRKTVFKWGKYNCSSIGVMENNKKFDFYISKDENKNNIKFNDYLTFNDRKYYLAGNIKEFYVIDGESMILKSYITNFNHTLDNPSIDKITSELTEKEILKDGGTTIYKSKDKDITIVVCNTIDGNDDIFIGDNSVNFDDKLMCK